MNECINEPDLTKRKPLVPGGQSVRTASGSVGRASATAVQYLDLGAARRQFCRTCELRQRVPGCRRLRSIIPAGGWLVGTGFWPLPTPLARRLLRALCTSAAQGSATWTHEADLDSICSAKRGRRMQQRWHYLWLSWRLEAFRVAGPRFRPQPRLIV